MPSPYGGINFPVFPSVALGQGVASWSSVNINGAPFPAVAPAGSANIFNGRFKQSGTYAFPTIITETAPGAAGITFTDANGITPGPIYAGAFVYAGTPFQISAVNPQFITSLDIEDSLTPVMSIAALSPSYFTPLIGLTDVFFVNTFPVTSQFSTLISCVNLINAGFSGFSGVLPSILNLTALQVIDVTGNSLIGNVPNFTSNTALISVFLTDNHLTGWDLGGSSLTLDTLFIDNNPLTYVPDLSVYTVLRQLYASKLPLQNWFTAAIPSTLSYIDFQNGSITQSVVDAILLSVVNGSAPAPIGYQLLLDGGTNAAPSAAGLLNVATLVALGWIVTHN